MSSTCFSFHRHFYERIQDYWGAEHFIRYARFPPSLTLVVSHLNTQPKSSTLVDNCYEWDTYEWYNIVLTFGLVVTQISIATFMNTVQYFAGNSAVQISALCSCAALLVAPSLKNVYAFGTLVGFYEILYGRADFVFSANPRAFGSTLRRVWIFIRAIHAMAPQAGYRWDRPREADEKNTKKPSKLQRKKSEQLHL